MDPITQGLLGAAVGQMFMGRRLPRIGWLIAMAGGMTADLDVLIHSADNPLVDWIYHRHFTHSLFFIPIGGALTALPFLLAPSLRPRWREVVAASTIGYATHALLDASTSYGTLLLWPFSNARIAWDIIGIVDLVFTPLLLLGLVLSVLLRRPWISGVAFGLAMGYMAMGVMNHARALAVQKTLVQARGHERVRGRVMPSPGSLVLWRSIYESDGRIHADGIRTPYLSRPLVQVGDSRPSVTRDLFEATHTDRADRRAFRVFSWFTDDYLVAMDGHPSRFGDGRYTVGLVGFSSLWGLDVAPENGREFDRWMTAERGGFAGRLWNLLLRGSDEFVSVEDAVSRLREPELARSESRGTGDAADGTSP